MKLLFTPERPGRVVLVRPPAQLQEQAVSALQLALPAHVRSMPIAYDGFS
jgi:hypothetical protein